MSVSSEDTLRETVSASGRVQTYPPPKTVPEYSDSPSYPSSPERFMPDNITQKHGEDAEAGTSGLVVIEVNDEFSGEPLELKSSKRPFSPDMLDAVSETPRKKRVFN
ncbi:hypothetical protein EVAR_87977_1 [Eumeta japonica]|uniref:Uncharacterized protein n=1 Tax=Eumeta variegata TaxID=151549 RepID=A0A4C1VB80_EUMVA|nr:hypothetical protein EVAR_87977_1 [Eumeta japonica]